MDHMVQLRDIALVIVCSLVSFQYKGGVVESRGTSRGAQRHFNPSLASTGPPCFFLTFQSSAKHGCIMNQACFFLFWESVPTQKRWISLSCTLKPPIALFSASCIPPSKQTSVASACPGPAGECCNPLVYFASR